MDIANQVLATLAECRRQGIPVEVTLKYASIVAQPYEYDDEDEDEC